MIILLEVRLFCRNTIYIHMHVCTSRMYCVKYVKFICNIFSHKNLKLHGSSHAPHWGAVFSSQSIYTITTLQVENYINWNSYNNKITTTATIKTNKWIKIHYNMVNNKILSLFLFSLFVLFLQTIPRILALWADFYYYGGEFYLLIYSRTLSLSSLHAFAFHTILFYIYTYVCIYGQHNVYFYPGGKQCHTVEENYSTLSSVVELPANIKCVCSQKN